jgi:spermidine synthase
MRWYRRAVDECPTMVRGYRNLANLLVRSALAQPTHGVQADTQLQAGRAQDLDEAEQWLRMAHAIAPRDAETNQMLADLLMLRGRAEAAIPFYEQSLAAEPQRLTGRSRLAEAYALAGREEEAIALLRGVVALGPPEASPYVVLGRLLLARGQAAQAAAILNAATRNVPANTDLLLLLAAAQLEAGESRQAAATFRTVLKRNADHLAAMNGLAWLLATDPDPTVRDGNHAVRLAESVCRATGFRAFEPLDTLAAACAADGRFREAQEYAQQALATAAEAGVLAARLEAMRSRLEGYRAGRPFLRSPHGSTSSPATSSAPASRSAVNP